MLLPKNWHTLALDQKFAYALALAQERRDARKPECRKTAVVSKSGKVLKPATIACGSTCRQPKNCGLSKAEKRRIQSRVGTDPDALRRAIVVAKRKKRQGRSGTGAVYEATKEALGAAGQARNEKRKARGEKPRKVKPSDTKPESQENLVKPAQQKSAATISIPRQMPSRPSDRLAQTAPARKEIESLVAGLTPEQMAEVGWLIRMAQNDLRQMEAGKRGKETLTSDQYRFGFENVIDAINRAKAMVGRGDRRDSYLSEGYFGLNPNPFHHPLWDLMGF